MFIFIFTWIFVVVAFLPKLAYLELNQVFFAHISLSNANPAFLRQLYLHLASQVILPRINTSHCDKKSLPYHILRISFEI